MKLSIRNIVIILLMFIGFLTFTGAFFIVNETKQAIVLQFGDPRKVITEPGLQFKIPFIQDAVFLDSRLLNSKTTLLGAHTPPPGFKCAPFGAPKFNVFFDLDFWSL